MKWCPGSENKREHVLYTMPGKVILQIKNYTNSPLFLATQQNNLAVYSHTIGISPKWNSKSWRFFCGQKVWFITNFFITLLFIWFILVLFFFAVGILYGVWMKRIYSESWSLKNHVEMILCQNHVLLAKHSTPKWWRCQSIRGNKTYPLYVKSFWHFWVKNKNSSHIIRNFVRDISYKQNENARLGVEALVYPRVNTFTSKNWIQSEQLLHPLQEIP